MSGTAIAQVTAALKGLLKASLDNNVSVTLLQPNDALINNSVNLYLFRVIENPQLKNTNFRGDRTRPATNFPPLALDLYYLLTPFADPPASSANTLPQAHMLLGQAMQVFHDTPVINDIHTAGFDFDTFTGINDLRNSFDKITVRLQTISIDDFSKIWTLFAQPYRLSVIYQVSIVQIAPTEPASSTAPVLVTALDVFTLDPPRLVSLSPLSGGTGGTLTLDGFGLSRKTFLTKVRFGGETFDPTSSTEKLVSLNIPSDLDAGPDQEVRVLLDRQASNPLTYTVSPWLRRLQPLRGAPGVAPLPVTLEILGADLLTAGPISVTLAGAVRPHIVIDGSHLSITALSSLTIGQHPAQVSISGQASNTRQFEVTPLIQTLNPASPVVGSPLQIDGLRLDGAKVRVDFGAASFDIGSNASAVQVQVPRVPRLDPGSYELHVRVDGIESNALSFTIT